jgi:hypothetical protein
MPHIPGHIVQPPIGNGMGGNPNQTASRSVSKMGGDSGRPVSKMGPVTDFFKQLVTDMAGNVVAGAEGLWDFVVTAGEKLFGEDAVFSMDNMLELGTMYFIAESLAKPDGTKENVRNLKAAYENILPAFVQGKIQQGEIEQTAINELNTYLLHGIKTKTYNQEDQDAGKIPQGKQIGDKYAVKVAPGSEDLRLMAATGQQPQFELDANGDIVLDPVTKQPKTLSAGFPGTQTLLRAYDRDQTLLDRLAHARGTANVFDPEAGTMQTVGKGFRAFEEAASPYLDPSQKQQAASLQALLGSMDPTKLSGSEMTNVERGLGRMGIGVGRTAEMDKYKAALTFGDALAQKQDRLAQALGQTASIVPSFGTKYNPAVVAGQGGMANLPVAPGQVTTFGTTAGTGLGAATGMVDTSAGYGGKDWLRGTILGQKEPTNLPGE